MAELEGHRAKEIKVIQGRGEAAPWTEGVEEIAFGPSFRAQGLTDKHPHASFQSRAGYHHVMK